MDIAPYKKPEYFRNRELSWISFDERVLNEARDKSIPLSLIHISEPTRP